jgi:hypothetical protein
MLSAFPYGLLSNAARLVPRFSNPRGDGQGSMVPRGLTERLCAR